MWWILNRPIFTVISLHNMELSIVGYDDIYHMLLFLIIYYLDI